MKKRLDMWLIGGVLLFAFVFGAYLYITREEGAFVVVEVEGREIGKYALSESLTTQIATALGTNTLSIENGTAKVTGADCPDKLCVNQGTIRFQGESIICLPHKLNIRIEGGEMGGVDAVAR